MEAGNGIIRTSQMSDMPNFGALRDRRLWKKLENWGM